MTRASANTVPRSAEFCAERFYRFEGGEVHLDVRLDVEHEPAGTSRGLVRGSQRAAPEVGGVGEEQWCVVAVHHEPRDGLRGRVVVDVVHARQAGDAAEDCVVRPCYPQQQLGDRQADGEQDAVENVEGQDAGAGGQGQQHLGAAEGEQPPERLDIDQPDRGVDDDRAEGGIRESRQHRPGKEQDGNRGRRRHHGVHLGSAARRDGDGGPGGAAADREPMQQARPCVGGTQRQQLLVGPDLLIRAARTTVRSARHR